MTHQKPPKGFVFIQDYTDENGNVVEGIASRLGISPSTYKKWRMRGQGPNTTKIGKKVAAHEDALTSYFNEMHRSAMRPSQDSRPPEARSVRARAAA